MLLTSPAQTITLSDAQGFDHVAGSPRSIGTSGAAGAVELAVFWCRATGASMSAPTVAAVANDVGGCILTFRGCSPTGNPWNFTNSNTAANAATTAVPGGTTGVDDCLIVAINGDSSGTDPLYSNWANADLANVTEISDVHPNVGLASGFGVATGEKATAGSFGVTTADMAASSPTARIVLALRGEHGPEALTATMALMGFI